MLTNLKAFTTVVAIGGSFIGVPVTLWQTNFLTTSRPKVRTITKTLSNAEKQIQKQGNCDVESLSPKNENFLLSQKQGGKFYVEILCYKTNIGEGDRTLPDAWTGLFPAQLLSKGERLSIEEKLNLETEGELSGEIRKTTFKGEGMERAVTGEWGKESITWGKQSIKPVSFLENAENKNKLYLIFH